MRAAPAKNGLSSRIFLAYNSKARDGSLFLDNTPRSNRFSAAPRRKRGMHALSLPGTHQCVTRHVKDVLHCLGGIRVLFPLFGQLDQPTKVPKSAASIAAAAAAALVTASELKEHKDAKDGKESDSKSVADSAAAAVPAAKPAIVAAGSSPPSVPGPALGLGLGLGPDAGDTKLAASAGVAAGLSEAKLEVKASSDVKEAPFDLCHTVDPRLLVNIVRVLNVMLADNPINQSFIQKAKGFAVIGHQLERVSPRHFSSSAIQALEQLVAVSYASADGELFKVQGVALCSLSHCLRVR